MLFNIQIFQISYICIEYNKKTLTQMCEVDIVPELHIMDWEFRQFDDEMANLHFHLHELT